MLTAEPDRRAVVVVTGPPRSGRDTVAAAVAHAAGCAIHAVASGELLDAVRRPHIRRDALWTASAVMLGDEPHGLTPELAHAITDLGVPVVLVRRDLAIEALASRMPVHVIEHHPPDLARQRALWERATGMQPPTLAGRSFGPGRITAAARLANTRASADGRTLEAADLAWASRVIPAADFGALAQRLPASASRRDLILPPVCARDFNRAVVAARSLREVAERWRIDGRGALVGLAMLFAGAPGTGKTLAARIVGAELGLDVHRVDLSQIVDKYVGETEKHLDRVFAAAAEAEVVLFFDEAEALFGGRTRGDDAHDRYQNLQTGFLLQRIEQHPGITILATNQRERLDPAFARRMHVVIDFPEPGPAECAAMWRRYLPSPHRADVDVAFVADRFALTGADIRNVVLSAELAAVGRGDIVGMDDVCIAIALSQRAAGRVLEVDKFGPWRAAVLRFVQGA